MQQLGNCASNFKAARYFSPETMNELRPSPNDLDALSMFPIIDTILLEQLKGELAAYMAAAHSYMYRQKSNNY